MERRDAERQSLTVAVNGATGFVGRHVVAVLVEQGHHVRAISRDGERRSEWGASVSAMAGDVETGEGLVEAFRGADVVVHLVAIPRDERGRTMDEVNARGTGRVVAAMRDAGVRRIVHLSALGVIDDPQLHYLSSKWRGEQIVRESGLEWIVLRPSLLFGPGDGFFSLIRTTLTWWSPGIVAIPGDGATRFQPLSVRDLALGVARCVAEPERSGSVYELGGPAHVTYREVVDAVMQATGKHRVKLNMPIPILRALTVVTDRVLPIFPVSHDQIASLGRPNFTDLDAFEKAFGIEPVAFDVSYLGRRQPA